MSQTIVSLIGWETMPNIEIIKEFSDEDTRHIFVTTKDMENPDDNRSTWVMMACHLKMQEVTKIMVKPNSITNITQALSKQAWDKNETYIVNITGGTKLMSIACLDFFSQFENAQIIYKYIGKNYYQQIYPKLNQPEFELKTKISLKEYLTAYGLKIKFQEHNLKDNRIATELFNQCVATNNNIDEIPEIKKAFKHRSKHDKSFYSGGWFEEYIYYQIKSTLHLSNDEIAMKVRIKNHLSNNEYDVVFMYQNKIYLIECKAYFSPIHVKEKLEDDLYKLGALDDDFGINARSVLITNFNIADVNHKASQTIIRRAEDLKVGFLQMNDLKQKGFIKKEIN